MSQTFYLWEIWAKKPNVIGFRHACIFALMHFVCVVQSSHFNFQFSLFSVLVGIAPVRDWDWGPWAGAGTAWDWDWGPWAQAGTGTAVPGWGLGLLGTVGLQSQGDQGTGTAIANHIEGLQSAIWDCL